MRREPRRRTGILSDRWDKECAVQALQFQRKGVGYKSTLSEHAGLHTAKNLQERRGYAGDSERKQLGMRYVCVSSRVSPAISRKIVHVVRMCCRRLLEQESNLSVVGGHVGRVLLVHLIHISLIKVGRDCLRRLHGIVRLSLVHVE